MNIIELVDKLKKQVELSWGKFEKAEYLANTHKDLAKKIKSQKDMAIIARQFSYLDDYIKSYLEMGYAIRIQNK